VQYNLPSIFRGFIQNINTHWSQWEETVCALLTASMGRVGSLVYLVAVSIKMNTGWLTRCTVTLDVPHYQIMNERHGWKLKVSGSHHITTGQLRSDGMWGQVRSIFHHPLSRLFWKRTWTRVAPSPKEESSWYVQVLFSILTGNNIKSSDTT